MKSVVASSLLVGLAAAAATALTPLQILQGLSAKSDKYCDKKCDKAWLDCLKDTDKIPTGDSKREAAGHDCNQARTVCVTPPACTARNLLEGTHDKCHLECLEKVEKFEIDEIGVPRCGERDWDCLYPYHKCREACFDRDDGPLGNEIDTGASQGSNSSDLTPDSKTNESDPMDPKKMLVGTSGSDNTTTMMDGQEPMTKEWSQNDTQSLDDEDGPVMSGTNVTVENGESKVIDLEGNPLPITRGRPVPSTNTTDITAGGMNVTDITGDETSTVVTGDNKATNVIGMDCKPLLDTLGSPVLDKDGKTVYNETNCMPATESETTGTTAGERPVTVPVGGAGSAVFVPFGAAVIAAFLAL